MQSNPSPIRWFAAELLVVVAGVLIALGAQGAWQWRQNRESERNYLRQLSSDLQRTDSLMGRADSVMVTSETAANNLISAMMYSPTPPDDSIVTWLHAFWYVESPNPVNATAEALVASGDLRLLRNDNLKSAVISYVEENRNYIASQTQFVEFIMQHGAEVFRAVNPFDLHRMDIPKTAFDSMNAVHHRSYVRPFPVDLKEMLRNRDVYNSVYFSGLGYANLRELRKQARVRAVDLQKKVDRALSGRAL